MAAFRSRPRITVTIAAAAALIFVACDSFPESRQELEAVRVMRAIHAAEHRYQLHHGHYASLDELGPQASGLPAAATRSGYYFHLNLTNGGYNVTAVRRAANRQQSFYMDNTGVIRRSLGPSLASARSTRIDGPQYFVAPPQSWSSQIARFHTHAHPQGDML